MNHVDIVSHAAAKLAIANLNMVKRRNGRHYVVVH